MEVTATKLQMLRAEACALAISHYYPKISINTILVLQRIIYSPSQQAETGNYTVHLLLCITMKFKYLENLASLCC